MSHIFVSYDSDDRELAQRVANELAKAKKKGWLDLSDIRLGGPWRDEIERALRTAEAVVVILTPRSSLNQYVTYEWSFALGAGVRIIPLLGKGLKINKVHKRLQNLQCLDLSGDTEPWGRFIHAVTASTVPSPSTTKKKKNSSIPTIHAEFELDEGIPVRVKKSYLIWVSTKGVPDGTKRVSYEVLDDSFEDPKFSVPWGRRDFAEWINSYGDVYLIAKGKAGGARWRTQATLAEALHRHYGRRPKATIQKAIATIENN